MENDSSSYLENDNLENNNKNYISFYIFDNNSIYIIILNIIVIFLKPRIIRKKEKQSSFNFSQLDSISESICHENDFKIKNELENTQIVRKLKLKNEKKKIKEYLIRIKKKTKL